MKVASDKKFGQHFSQHSTGLRPLSNIMAPLFVYKNTNSFILSRAYINNKHKL
jgi:hypothetical protein